MPQRSLIIAWLLLAANVCADIVALTWMQPASRAELSEVVFFALIASQLSAVCIWSALRPKMSIWTRVAPVAGVVTSALAFELVDADAAKDFLPFFGLQAAGLLVLLWVFRRSAYWRRRSGVDTNWQFTVAQLLIVTTVVALLAAALRQGSLFNSGDFLLVAAFLCCSVALAIASVFLWSRASHWLLRLASVLVIAIGLGASFYVEDIFMMWYATVHYVVQGIVLSTWLVWGQILPLNERRDAAET